VTPKCASRPEARSTQVHGVRTDDLDFTAFLEPGLTILGHEHRLYYAFPTSTAGDISILGPDERFKSLSTRSIEGIFRLAIVYATLLDYGCGEAAGEPLVETFIEKFTDGFA
jgi:hypothetical protein